MGKTNGAHFSGTSRHRLLQSSMVVAETKIGVVPIFLSLSHVYSTWECNMPTLWMVILYIAYCMIKKDHHLYNLNVKLKWQLYRFSTLTLFIVPVPVLVSHEGYNIIWMFFTLWFQQLCMPDDVTDIQAELQSWTSLNPHSKIFSIFNSGTIQNG